MYEIFGNAEAVTVRKTDIIHKSHRSTSIPIKDELSQKLRPLSLGSSKKVLGDVKNKVSYSLTIDAQLHSSSQSPCKSTKKSLFSEKSVPGDRAAKSSGIQISKREKSPTEVKKQSTPKPTPKSSALGAAKVKPTPKSSALGAAKVKPTPKSSAPKSSALGAAKVKPTPKTSALGAAKVSIFVDNWSDSCQEPSDPFDEVFLPNQDELDIYDLEASPQEIYGYSEGYETPDDDVDGWLLESMWENKEDLAGIIDLEPSEEIEPNLPDIDDLYVQSPEDDTRFGDLFEVDDTCYPEPLDDFYLADLEW